MKLAIPKHMEGRLNPDARMLHEIREATRLPRFLNQARGTCAPDYEHARVHTYFDRLCRDQEFEKRELWALPDQTRAGVRSLTNAAYAQFGISVSALFSQLLEIIQPAAVIATNHEYTGLVERARTGVLDYDNLLTWQMYGLGGRGVTREGGVYAPIPVHLVDPTRIDMALRKAHEIDGSAIILVSHVSRVDGRILPVYEIDAQIKKINKTRSNDKQIHFVVDGSQAIGSGEVDLAEFGGIYLFTSSKALQAEPCVGVAVGNDCQAPRIESIRPVISLPELDSLCRMISETHFTKAFGELALMKIEVMKLMRAVPRISIPPHKVSSPYMVYFSIPRVDPRSIQLFNASSPYTVHPSVPVVNPIEIQKAAAREGFDIYGEEQKYVYTKPEYARISWTVDTPWKHIEEFVLFLRDFVRQLRWWG